MTPDDRLAILVARGNDATGSTPEDPRFVEGLQLQGWRADEGSVDRRRTAAAGSDPGTSISIPRSRGCMCRSSARTRCMSTGLKKGDDQLTVRSESTRRRHWRTPTASSRAAGRGHRARAPQRPCPLRREPRGYHQGGVRRPEGVFIGGENTLVVYSINQSTGELTPIQHVDTRGIHCRTFQIDPSGRMLVAAHNPAGAGQGRRRR